MNNERQEGILFTIDCVKNHKYNFDYCFEEQIKEVSQLQQENKQLKEQLKQRDEVIDEAIRKCELEISASTYHLEKRNSQLELCHKVAHERILEILQKYKGDSNE